MASRFIILSLGLVPLMTMALDGPALAQAIRIQNGGEVEFYYCIRHRSGEPWSTTFELEPGQTHTLDASEPIVISYWTDKARFDTLDPGRSYRVDDPRNGPLRAVTTTLRPTITEGAAPGPATSAGAPAATETAAPATDGIRILRLTALADTTYRQVVDDWRQRIRDTVAGASEYYEANFRIRLVLDKVIRSWDYGGLKDDVESRLEHVLLESPGQADLLVAFIGFGEFYRQQEQTFFIGHLGLASPFGRHLLVTGNDDYHVNREIAVLIHELGHVFGAFHVVDPRSPMQPCYEDIPVREILQTQLPVDAVSAEIINLTRNVDFRQGVASLDPDTCRRLRDLARQHRHPTELFAPSPIALAHFFDKLRNDVRLVSELAGSHAETEAAGLKPNDKVRVTAESTELTAEGYTLAAVPKDATLKVLHVTDDRLHVAWESGVLKGWVRVDQLVDRSQGRSFRDGQLLWTGEEADLFNGEYLLTTLPRGIRVLAESVREKYVLVTVKEQELGNHKAARLVFEPVIEGWVPRASVTKVVATPEREDAARRR